MATEYFSGNRMQSQVAEFHKKFGHPIGERPGFSRPELRARLILEEALETAAGLVGSVTAINVAKEEFNKLFAKPPVRPGLPEAVDGLCDLLYVTFGAAVEMGLDIQQFFDEVHRSNMAKEGGPRRADGKTLKPPGWQPPRICELLEAMGWRPPAPDAEPMKPPAPARGGLVDDLLAGAERIASSDPNPLPPSYRILGQTPPEGARCDEPACGWYGTMGMLLREEDGVTHCPRCHSTAIAENVAAPDPATYAAPEVP